MKNKKIKIYFSDHCNDTLIGNLYVDIIKGKEIYSLELEEEYLSSGKQYVLDPEVNNVSGRQYKEKADELYGFIQDCMPDRWGKNLIKRAEKRLANLEGREPETLGESDFLLRVDDISREGALRFKIGNGPFLSSLKEHIPTLVFINKLERLAYDISSLEDEDIKDLFLPGSSLGGSRPKACVYDNDGNLLLAKFAHKNDDYDVAALEGICNDLARSVGINVPEFYVLKSEYLKNKSIFIAKRFDRNKKIRIGYVSAMTLLNANDGESDSYSYLDLVELINTYSTRPEEDRQELFKRMVFNVIIHNGDDHLRNHGFIMKDRGYVLSPAFDLVGSDSAQSLTLSINEYDKSFSLDNCIKVSKYFGLTIEKAVEIISFIKDIISKNIPIVSNKYNFPLNLLKKIINL